MPLAISHTCSPATPPPKLATSRYASGDLIVASGLAPVGITVGQPKFVLDYRLVGNVRMLAPYGLLSITDEDEFTRRYRDRLDGHGADKILRVLTAIARRERTAWRRDALFRARRRVLPPPRARCMARGEDGAKRAGARRLAPDPWRITIPRLPSSMRRCRDRPPRSLEASSALVRDAASSRAQG